MSGISSKNAVPEVRDQWQSNGGIIQPIFYSVSIKDVFTFMEIDGIYSLKRVLGSWDPFIGAYSSNLTFNKIVK
jgi:hypothetical protein